MNCHVDSHFQNKIVLRQVPDCVSSWINGVTLPTDLFGAVIFSEPAKTFVSPPSSSLGTFRAEERVSPCAKRPQRAKSEEKRMFSQAIERSVT